MIEILAKRLFSFSIIVFSMKLLVKLFIRKKKHLLGNIFGSLHTSNRISLLRNCFSNYVYVKDMHIILKGIEKMLFVLVLRILLICRFLNFTTTFTKKIKSSKFAFNFPREKVNFSLIHQIRITIQSYILSNKH